MSHRQTPRHPARSSGAGGFARFVLLTVLLSTATTALRAEDVDARLGLHEALARALDREPGLEVVRARLDAAQSNAAFLETALLPTVQLSGSAKRFDKPMVVTPIHGFTPGTLPAFDDTLIQGAVTGTYSLYEGGARKARIEQGYSAVDAASAGVVNQEQALLLRTTAAYLEVLGQNELLAAHDSRREALEAEEDRVRRFLEVGRAAQVEARRIEAALAAAEAESVRTSSALDLAERNLARLIDLPVEATRAHRLDIVRLVPDDHPARADLAGRAKANNPDVARKNAELAVAGSAITVARSGRRPKVLLEGAWLDFGSSQWNFTSEWQAGVRFGIPLFDAGATTLRVASARAERSAALADLRLAEQRVDEVLDRVLARAEETKAQVTSLERAVERYAEVRRIEQLRVDVGVGTQTDLLTAESELLESRAALVQARLRLTLSRFELAQVVGELGLEWVEKNLTSGGRETP